MKVIFKGWKFLLNNRGETGDEANQDEGINPLEAALNQQMPTAENTDGVPKAPEEEEEAPAKKKEEPAKKEEKDEDLIDIEGYKGKNRRATGFSGDEKRKDIIEKLENMDLDFDYGKDKSRKITVKEAKETLKWLQDNNEIIGSGISMNKYIKEFPDFGKLIKAVITGSFGADDKFNGEFATKILGAIEAKEEVIDEKVDEIDAEIAKMQKLLDDGDIDEDSAQADAIKGSIASMKAMKGQMNKALSKLDEVTKKFDGFETKQQAAADATKTTEYKDEVKRVAALFKEELATLTNKDKEDGYKFVIDTEAEEFDSLVRARVAKAFADLGLKQGESITDEKFKALIADSAKTSYEVLVKKREAIEQAYAVRKGTKKVEVKKDEEEAPEAENEMNLEDLSKTVEDMLPK